MIIDSDWCGEVTLERSSMDFSYILCSFLDSNYTQTIRRSEKTEWGTFPAEVLWASIRLQKPLPADPQRRSQKWSHLWVQNAGLQAWPKICSCSLPFYRRKIDEGVRCSLDRNWLIYSKLSLGHTSTLFMKSCHCLYSCISTTCGMQWACSGIPLPSPWLHFQVVVSFYSDAQQATSSKTIC